LGARYLIEGSVRKAGDRVRITAQLVQADNGANVWTENYDRQLTDVFATQEDIAQAIAASLRVPLGLKQGENLVNNRSIDPESYQQYLRARALVRARGSPLEPGPLAEAARLLESVVVRNAAYAPAWALLAQAYGYTPIYTADTGIVEELRRVVDASFPRAEAAARRAIELDPNGSDGYMSLALAQQMRGKFLEAEESALKALALDPNNADALNQYSYQLEEVGRLKEGLALRQKLQALEPFVPAFNSGLAYSLWLNGQTDAAIAMLKTFPADRQAGLASIYARQGRYSEAADLLQAMPSNAYPPGQLQAAVRLLRTAPAAAASPQSLPRLGGLGYIYLYVGAPARVLEYYEGNAEIGAPVVSPTSYFWYSSYAPLRATERFKALMRKAGFVDYWRAKGWPDLCHPTTGDDFACE
jgi:tetratricopeptide (TPR) repeat protein